MDNLAQPRWLPFRLQPCSFENEYRVHIDLCQIDLYSKELPKQKIKEFDICIKKFINLLKMSNEEYIGIALMKLCFFYFIVKPFMCGASRLNWKPAQCLILSVRTLNY